MQYLYAFTRFWWLIVLSIVVGGLLTFVLDGVLAPPYTSTARVLVSTSKSAGANTSEGYYGALLAQQRALSYAEVVHGPQLTSTLIDDLGLTVTPASLAARIRVTVPTNTSVLDISVDDASSSRAQQIATDAAKIVASEINTQESARERGTSLLRAQTVGDATSPTASTSRRNTAFGAAGGLLVGLILAVGAARIDRRLRHVEEVKEAAGRATVTAVLPRRRRTPLPRRRASWEEAVRELRTTVFFSSSVPDHGLIVTVTSVDKVGQLADLGTDLAASLADAGARVLLVDADLRHSGGFVRPDPIREQDAGLADYLEERTAENAVIGNRTQGERGADVLRSGLTTADPADLLHSQAFARLVDDAARHYEFVVLTTPSLSIGTDALAVAARSDLTLLTVERGRTREAHLQTALDQLDGVGSSTHVVFLV